jgi:hypothetical protein
VVSKFLEQVPEARPIPEAEAQAILRALREEMTRKPWWRRRAVVFSFGLAAAVATAGGTATYVAFREPTDRSVVTCYAEASTAADTRSIDAALAEANGDGPAEVENALQLCGQVWRDGLLAGDPGDPPVFGSTQAPDLVACTLPDGSLGVFPGGAATCPRLGLPAEGP